MPTTILPKLDKTQLSEIEQDGLGKLLQETGRLPPVSLVVSPVDKSRPTFSLDRFIDYQFSSSVVVPVDSFSFSFAAPDSDEPFNKTVKPGDMVRLYANGVALSTGIIDQTDIETDAERGEMVKIIGRNLMSQFEDQSSVNDKSIPVYGNNMTVDQVFATLKVGTRIQNLVKRNATTRPWLFATAPGESKLQSLSRYLEPLNLLCWSDELGNLVVGKPNMAQKTSGTIFCSKENRSSNVLSIKCVRGEAKIPNFIVPIWQGQEDVVARVAPEQGFANSAQGPARLRAAGHFLTKTVEVSTPQGASPQDLSNVNQLKVGSGNLLQAYAKRELARANMEEVLVQAVMMGHYNEKGEKFHIDHTYRVIYDRADLDEVMYLYQVDYQGGEGTSQKTVLSFCRLGTIVADTPVQ